MLTLKDLQIEQGTFALAADWSVGPGVTAVIGASGCGKSTLLAAIAGFLLPVAGQLRWDDLDVTQVAPGQRPISVLFQDNNLFPHLTIAQNVGLGLRPDLRLSAAQTAQVEAALVDVGLDDLGSRKPRGLSGGQQSRAALARVLLADRPVVLLDEPFAALGPGLRSEMLALVREKLVGRCVLMVTHDPSDARVVADQIILVADYQTAPSSPPAPAPHHPPPE